MLDVMSSFDKLKDANQSFSNIFILARKGTYIDYSDASFYKEHLLLSADWESDFLVD